MQNLTALETSIVETIVKENLNKYQFLLEHLPLIKVKSREYTGVGLYTNFEYNRFISAALINDLLSSNKRLFIDNLENELSYVLDVTDGKINFLEITTNGNDVWDGNFENFTLVD